MGEIRYAEVIVDIPAQEVDRPFTYEIPSHLLPLVTVGSVVLVPFGKRREIGYVESLSPTTSITSTLPIIDLLEEIPAFNQEMVELCRWVADYYFSTRGEALKLALPPGRIRKITSKIILKARGPDSEAARKDTKQRKLLEALNAAGGEMTVSELEKIFPETNLSSLLKQLQDEGLIERRYSAAAPKVLTKWEEWCELEKDFRAGELESAGNAPKQKAILAALLECGEPVPVRRLLELAGASRQSLKALERAGKLKMFKVEVLRKPPSWKFCAVDSPFKLTPEQTAAVAEIKKSLENQTSQVFLLQGVTGSGKTEVYLQSIECVLKMGKTAIVIVPEIVLTAQTVERFRERFGDRVAVMHSGLSAGERFDQWRAVSRGNYQVVVGARSAIFAPVKNLGLVVVDEEHEATYKQNRSPRYHAREVAIRRARLNGASAILGSATPSIESRYKCEVGEFHLLGLPYRVENRPLPEIEVVDMREGERSQIFHPRLKEELDRATRAEDKVILFLNRRGFASFIMCRDCGLVMRCRHCAVSLTYHIKVRRTLKCHHCGSQMQSPEVCPQCASHRVGYFGVGTQRIESEVGSLYPDYKIIRMDTDALRTKSAYVHKLLEFSSTPKALLLGTQMIAKGLDFPEVTLVGVVNADTALNLPDFRSAERTFQLMMQVSGRAGRGAKPGRVIVQTYAPDHYAIESVREGSYDMFYQRELAFRKELNYPPFSSLVNIVVSGKQEKEVSEVAVELAKFLSEREVRRWAGLLGPTEAPIPKIRANYRWHMILKGRDKGLNTFLRSTMPDFLRTIERKSTSIIVDADPVWLL